MKRLVACGLLAMTLGAFAADSSTKKKKASNTARDGGTASSGGVIIVSEPPRSARSTQGAPDASIANAPLRDAGQDVDRAEVERLRREVEDLRQRTDSLEKQIAREQGQQAQLKDISDQMKAMRAQMQEAESRKQDAEERVEQHRQDVDRAVDVLVDAQATIAAGNSTVDAQLADAAAVLNGSARRDIDAARQALANKDLATARSFLQAAIVAARSGR